MPKHNPYESPSETNPPPQHQIASEPLRTIQFRWRTIPITLLLGFGGISLVAGLFATSMMAYTSWTGAPLYEPGPADFSREGIVVAVWSILTGIGLLSSAAYWRRGKWGTAVMVVSVVIAVSWGATSIGILPTE